MKDIKVGDRLIDVACDCGLDPCPHIKPAAKKKQGRPSIYTKELADSICNAIASHALGLKAQKKSHPGWPDLNTIYEWIADNREGFGDAYARAKVKQLQNMEDEMLEIADDGSNDWQMTQRGPMISREAVQRSALRIDTRKWLMAHLLPKKYSDKLSLSGEDGGPVELVVKYIGGDKDAKHK